jgi:hypothetical protein
MNNTRLRSVRDLKKIPTRLDMRGVDEYNCLVPFKRSFLWLNRLEQHAIGHK